MACSASLDFAHNLIALGERFWALQALFQSSFRRVFGHGDAVFEHLQQLHLFATGFNAQDGGFEIGLFMALA